MMRTANSLRNMSTAAVQILITIVLRFVAQSYFVHILGLKYQGLNGLFSSIIGMLGMAELGLGTAILFNMYGFIAKKDTDTIQALLRFYKWCYRFVALIVAVFGLILLPFLPMMVDMSSISENVYIIYLLFLIDAVVSYLFIYKQSILIAHQKTHVITMADLAYNIVYNLGQIALLILTHNFTLILMIVIVLQVMKNIWINAIADKRYPYIKEKKVSKLKASIAHNFFKQMRGQVFHIFGGFVVFGTDSLVISSFLGLKVMGLYSNYLLITNTLNNFFLQIVGAVTPSVGDLLTEHNDDESFAVHKKLSFVCFWLYSFASVSIFVIMQPFINLWLGEGFLLPTTVLFVIALNFYVQGMRSPMTVFQQAAGIFYENRFVPLMEAAVNLVATLLFVQWFGLAGVLMGTVLCTMVLYGYSFPKYTFVPIFKREVSVYVKEQVSYLLSFALVFAFTAGLAHFVHVNNVWGEFILSVVLCLFIPNLICYFLFRKTEEFAYFKNLFLGLIFRKQKNS
ncbi:MAG: polysaccharide transporter [Streptococcaceae bacterium]|nr:polysaccharide transporter [Streptococcaceae bacterium]MCL2680971.1 polysaccharide transporter [Streptococcaceae bacterium]